MSCMVSKLRYGGHVRLLNNCGWFAIVPGCVTCPQVKAGLVCAIGGQLFCLQSVSNKN